MDKKIKWIFFDVGSTLIDETKAYEHRIMDVIEGTDITFGQFQEKRLFYARQNKRGDIEAMEFYGLTRTPWHTEDEVPYPEASDILRYLKEKGYGIGVIANQAPGTSGRLEKWGLLKYIDVVAASAELGISKPDRRIFERALNMAGCSADEAVMIGDRLDNDIVPAKRAGMQTVWIRQGFSVHQDPGLSEEQPDHITDDLNGLRDLF